MSCTCDHLLAVPFLIAVIHIFLAAGLGGCCFEEPLIWALEYGDFAVKYK